MLNLDDSKEIVVLASWASLSGVQPKLAACNSQAKLCQQPLENSCWFVSLEQVTG